MEISFDFDSTLSKKRIQEIAKRHISYGDNVHITTTRRDKINHVKLENSELFKIAEELGIPEKNVTFTNYEDKVDYLTDFDIHYDDDTYEVDLINRSKNKCIGILVGYKDYRNNS